MYSLRYFYSMLCVACFFSRSAEYSEHRDKMSNGQEKKIIIDKEKLARAKEIIYGKTVISAFCTETNKKISLEANLDDGTEVSCDKPRNHGSIVCTVCQPNQLIQFYVEGIWHSNEVEYLFNRLSAIIKDLQ